MSPMEQLAKQEYDRGYSDGKSDFFAAGVAEGEMRARQRMIANRVVANQHPFAASGKPIIGLRLAEIEDLQDIVTKALKKSFQLGQTYWQQADSEYFSQNKKADETQAKFYELEEEARATIREALADHSGDANEMVAEPVKHESVMDYEHICALREIEQIQAGDSYFFVRPENDTPTSRKMFFQGFERGFHKGLKYAAQVDAKAIRSERYFCQRCGKRVGDKNGALEGIHTCTPPEDCRGMK